MNKLDAIRERLNNTKPPNDEIELSLSSSPAAITLVRHAAHDLALLLKVIEVQRGALERFRHIWNCAFPEDGDAFVSNMKIAHTELSEAQAEVAKMLEENGNR